MKLLQDWVLIELEPEATQTRAGIVLTGPSPVRTAKVIAAGPGRHYKNNFVPTSVKPGDRFPFFKAATDTSNGKKLAEKLPDNQELIRETDILFVIEEGSVEISI